MISSVSLEAERELIGGSEEVRFERMPYAIVIERASGNYSAYVPDFPGCIATDDTEAEVEALIREAVEFHVAGLREDGAQVPVATSKVEYIDVAV